MKRKKMVFLIISLSILATIGIVWICMNGLIIQPLVPRPTQCCAYTEMEGIIKVKQTQEYLDDVKKYGKKNVSVTAVRYKSAKEASYLPYIDSNLQAIPGCIIVLYANDSGYVYQLNVKQQILYRMPIDQFKQELQKIDWDIIEKFYTQLTYK